MGTAYKLRFVQKFKEGEREAFLMLERQFAKLEQTNTDFPKGKRYLSYIGREPGNTLIWECEFPTIEKIHQALNLLNEDQNHEALYAKQSGFICESYTEIYRSLEFEEC